MYKNSCFIVLLQAQELASLKGVNQVPKCFNCQIPFGQFCHKFPVTWGVFRDFFEKKTFYAPEECGQQISDLCQRELA